MEAFEGPSLLVIGWFSALKCGYDSIVLRRPSCKKNYNHIITSEVPIKDLGLKYTLNARDVRTLVHWNIIQFRSHISYLNSEYII